MPISDDDKKIINNILNTYTFPNTQIIDLSNISADNVDIKILNNIGEGIRTLLFLSLTDISGVLTVSIKDDPSYKKELTQTVADAEEQTIENLRQRIEDIEEYEFYNATNKTITPSDAIIDTKIIRDIKYRNKTLIVLLDETRQTDTVEIIPENLQMYCPDNMKNIEPPKECECPECSNNSTMFIIIIIIILLLCGSSVAGVYFMHKK